MVPNVEGRRTKQTNIVKLKPQPHLWGEGKGECDILHCVLCCFVCEPLHSWFIVAMYNASKIYKENEM